MPKVLFNRAHDRNNYQEVLADTSYLAALKHLEVRQ